MKINTHRIAVRGTIIRHMHPMIALPSEWRWVLRCDFCRRFSRLRTLIGIAISVHPTEELFPNGEPRPMRGARIEIFTPPNKRYDLNLCVSRAIGGHYGISYEKFPPKWGDLGDRRVFFSTVRSRRQSAGIWFNNNRHGSGVRMVTIVHPMVPNLGDPPDR